MLKLFYQSLDWKLFLKQDVLYTLLHEQLIFMVFWQSVIKFFIENIFKLVYNFLSKLRLFNILKFLYFYVITIDIIIEYNKGCWNKEVFNIGQWSLKL